MSKMRIEGVPNTMGSQFKVFVGDAELPMVLGLALYLKPGEPAECSLTLGMDSVEVDGEFMTYLEGHIK